MVIKNIRAREILNSGATCSLEATVTLEDGSAGRASVPFGVSAGSHEAFVLFDGGQRYAGKGMLQAAKNINTEIRHALIGEDAYNQKAVDEKMIALDGTPNKSRLGANAILGVSLAVVRAAAASRKIELYEYLRTIFNFPISPSANLPKPMIVVIEGGKHADDSTDFQEYLIVPHISDERGRFSVKESVRAGAEVYLALKKVLQARGYNTNVGNEGAYAPSGISLNHEPWEFIAEAIERAGYRAGKDIMLAADPAASELVFRAPGADSKQTIGSVPQYQLKRENRRLASEELISYFEQWLLKYPFASLEDVLGEDDWESWVKAQARIGTRVRLIGDDLLVTNPLRLKQAIAMKACGGILIKLNQIGTVSETLETIAIAKDADFWTIVSHRGGGETNDTAMIDLAVACGCEMVKVGICRGERVEKYNRLMEIEDKLQCQNSNAKTATENQKTHYSYRP